jgi:chemotaxis protein histidine kinase CheA
LLRRTSKRRATCGLTHRTSLHSPPVNTKPCRTQSFARSSGSITLNSRAQTGRLNGREQKQLNTLQQQQAHQQLLREQTTQKLQEQQKLREQNAQKLQEEQKVREENAQKLQDERKLREQNAQKLEEQKLKDAQRLQEQQKLREQNAQKLQEEKKQREAQELRRKEAPRVTKEAAEKGRFAGNFQKRREAAETPAEEAREEAREAWRHRHSAFFVPWIGPIFWPYVYSDIFYYTFWPYGFDDGYWPYLYDDFFETVFWPNGGPYADYSYSGPYGGDFTAALPAPRPGGRLSARARATTQATQLARALCSDPGNGITAWPFAPIEMAVLPTSDQQALLDDLKKAAAIAASDFKAACFDRFSDDPAGPAQGDAEPPAGHARRR